jgi:hypothetical protein
VTQKVMNCNINHILITRIIVRASIYSEENYWFDGLLRARFMIFSNSGTLNNRPKSSPCANAVDEQCFPERIAMYVGPE